MPERRRGCAARCVSDVICGCHGDAIDWPTRRQTSRESRRHSDYCPPPVPLGPADRPSLPATLALSTTLIRLNVLAHDAARLHVRPCADTRARESARVRTHTHTCLSNYLCIPFDNPNSCTEATPFNRPLWKCCWAKLLSICLSRRR